MNEYTIIEEACKFVASCTDYNEDDYELHFAFATYLNGYVSESKKEEYEQLKSRIPISTIVRAIGNCEDGDYDKAICRRLNKVGDEKWVELVRLRNNIKAY